MPVLGPFDTDHQALSRRLQAHDRFGSRDLTQWILGHLDVHPGHHVLDLGCGTGRQSIPLATRVGEQGRVTAVDKSDQALQQLSSAAAHLGVTSRLQVVCVGFDDLPEQLAGAQFDRVIGAYALYYAGEPRKLLQFIECSLNPGGILFFCGPAADNNVELKQFLRSIDPDCCRERTAAAEFMEDIGPGIARTLFADVQVVAFDNVLRFDTPDALVAYWSSHNLYRESLAEAFASAAARHFEGEQHFTTTKRVIGIRGSVKSEA